jgi:hypothetical protein
MRLRQLLTRQDGITLIMAVAILGVLSLSGVTLIYYSGTNARSAEYSVQNASAYDLAEAGIDEMMAVLSKPTNNALNKYLLGYNANGTVTKTIHQFDGGRVEWSGTLDETNAVWTISSTGKVANPTGQISDVQRTLSAKVPVTPTYSQPLNNPAWNYIYSRGTGATCDMVIGQTVNVASPLYVDGNLCLQNQARISSGPLTVLGSVTMNQTANAIGSISVPINEAGIAQGCKWVNNASHNPCLWGFGSNGKDNLWANSIHNHPAAITAPSVDWEGWYVNASPGPHFPCVTSSGTPPTFDNDASPLPNPDPTRRNNSVNTIFQLTPASSYSCTTTGGSIAWDSTTRVLTVTGTFFIDGSAKIENGTINSYNGHATLYLSGTLLIKNSKMCALMNGANCTTQNWNPSSRLLVIVANGKGGQVPADTGIQLVSSHFQGALYATYAIDIGTTSLADGPLDGQPVKLGQSSNSAFPGFAVVPVGMPGNPAVYAQPNPPQLYSG